MLARGRLALTDWWLLRWLVPALGDMWRAWSPQPDRMPLFAALEAAGVPMKPADRSAQVTIDGSTLKVVVRVPPPGPLCLVISSDGPSLPTDLEIGAEDFVTAMGELGGFTDVTVGEPRFDQQVRVHGDDPATVLALFDHRTRRAVLRAVEAGARFSKGRWRLELVVPRRPSGERLRRTLEAVAAAHRTVRDGLERPLATGLLEQSRNDPARGVRSNALEQLIQRRLADASSLRTALADADPDIRLMAARALGGPEARGTLLALLREGHRATRVSAASLLVKDAGALAAEEARAVIGAATEALHEPETADDAAEVLARLASPAAARALVEAANRGSGSARRALQALRADAGTGGDLALANDRVGELSISKPRD